MSHFLTLNQYLLGSLFNIFEFAYSKLFWDRNLQSQIDLSKFKFIKSLNKYADVKDNFEVSLRRFKDNEYVITKKLLFRFKNLKYRQILNEASILKLIERKNKNGFKNNDVKFPGLINLIQAKNEVVLFREYINGKSLKHFNNEYKESIIEKVLDKLELISSNLSSTELKILPKRSPGYMILLIPWYFIRALIKNPKNLSIYLNSFFQFYSSCLLGQILRPKYLFSHRDLHSDNIFIDKNTPYIFDLEICSLAEKDTDLAIVSRYFLNEIGTGRMFNLIKKRIETQKDKKRFMRLTLFYTLQILANENKNDKYYIEADKYLSFLISEVKTKLLIHNKTLFHYLNIYFLEIINLLNYLISKKYSRKIKPTILCYHSIDNSNWMFSLSFNNFKKQIEYLTNTYKVVSLSDLLKGQPGTNKIAITFDDGYKNIIDQVVPLFKKLNLPACIFVIGDNLTVNRYELGTNEKLLRIEEIKILKSLGWEIGFHSKTHANFNNMTVSQLKEEIINGKKELEKKLGFSINYFAYPKGYYSNKVIEIIKEGLFTAAFTVDGGHLKKNSGNFTLNRIIIDNTYDLNQIKGLLSPAGLLFNNFLMNIVKLKERLNLSRK